MVAGQASVTNVAGLSAMSVARVPASLDPDMPYTGRQSWDKRGALVTYGIATDRSAYGR
jgi:hypothetical protein